MSLLSFEHEDFLQSQRCYQTSSETTSYARTQLRPSPHRQSKSYFESSPTNYRATLPTYGPTKLLIYQPALLFIFRTATISPTDGFDLLSFGFSICCARAAAILSTVLSSQKLVSAIKPQRLKLKLTLTSKLKLPIYTRFDTKSKNLPCNFQVTKCKNYPSEPLPAAFNLTLQTLTRPYQVLSISTKTQA